MRHRDEPGGDRTRVKEGGGPSERSPLVVTGQSCHDGAFRATSDIQQIELSRYLIQKVSHRSHLLSPAAITQIREHTRKKISLQYALKTFVPIRKLNQNICSHREEEEEEAEKKNPQLHLSMKQPQAQIHYVTRSLSAAELILLMAISSPTDQSRCLMRCNPLGRFPPVTHRN